MATTSRFESYVYDRMRELTAPRRERLQAAYDAEVKKLEDRKSRYFAALDKGFEALVSKVLAAARRDGCQIAGPEDGEEPERPCLPDHVKNGLASMLGLDMEYNFATGKRRWPEGSPARKAQDALEEFDGLRDREARRMVVYKMDLGMKPEAFEKMMAEAAERINRE